MKLVVLGSGTSIPHPERSAAAFWLETESGSVLLDCSADAPHRMAAERVDWPNLDAVWISHLHLDHCGGLAPLLFGLKWAPQTRARRKPLTIYGCVGLARILTAINDANNYRLFELPFAVEIKEVTAQTEFQLLTDLNARTFATPHTPESLALRVSDGLHELVYSSDTGYTEELAHFAQRADLFVLECSFRRDKPTPKHLDLTEAMRLARIAGPRKLLLTHLYPEWDGIDLEAEARRLWAGKTMAARDGLRIEIQD